MNVKAPMFNVSAKDLLALNDLGFICHLGFDI